MRVMLTPSPSHGQPKLARCTWVRWMLWRGSWRLLPALLIWGLLHGHYKTAQPLVLILPHHLQTGLSIRAISWLLFTTLLVRSICQPDGIQLLSLMGVYASTAIIPRWAWPRYKLKTQDIQMQHPLRLRYQAYSLFTNFLILVPTNLTLSPWTRSLATTRSMWIAVAWRWIIQLIPR